MEREDLHFGVGRITLVDPDTLAETEVAIATGVTVSFSSAGVEFRGGDYSYPVDIQLGDLSCEITAESARFKSEADLMDNAIYNVKLEAGQQGGGLTGTLTNFKVISYEVRSTQNAFIVSTLVLRKVAALS